MDTYRKALAWIKEHTIEERGIIVSTAQKIPYLEVTGYLIPTLLNLKVDHLAYQYADFLKYMQKPNGSFAGPDGQEYIFDSGQALRGLARIAKEDRSYLTSVRLCADYLLSQMQSDGRLPATYGKVIPEAVHVYVLPALAEASKVLDDEKYMQAAKRAVFFYKNSSNVLDESLLTHFYGYIIDGFIDMGETEFVRQAAIKVLSRQKSDGAISAYPNVSWVCSVGMAQFGIIAHKLGMRSQSLKCLKCLEGIQNESGGFYGSYGWGAKYFQKEEISWANKFYLDLALMNDQIMINQHQEVAVLEQAEWHKAMVDESVEQISTRLKKNHFTVWCKPLLEQTKAGESVLELGSGTGELAAILGIYGRQMHLLDYSPKSIDYAKALFDQLNLKGDFYLGNILHDLPVPSNGVDWVMSSGVLEHFTDDEIVAIMRKSASACRKGVMTFVPNARSLVYRAGKFAQEASGEWLYGKENPKTSMKPYFEAAGLRNITEHALGTYHAFRFLRQDYGLREFLDTLSPKELKDLGQGYLLFTCGEK